MLELDVFTLFPHWFAWLSEERAVQNALGSAASLRLALAARLLAAPHAQVDDAPFGGGAGHAAARRRHGRGARGRLRRSRSRRCAPGGGSSRSTRAAGGSTTPTRASWRPRERVTLLCGRYEGFDARILEHVATESLSLGPFVLSGGEPAAMAVIDALFRLLPGALGASTGTW